MHVWRLARAAFPGLTGEGARLAGGRWNRPGTPVVYTSATISLAVLEMLAHTDLRAIPSDLVAYEIAIPDTLPIEVVDVATLDATWRDPDDPAPCRAQGDAWVRSNAAAVLSVPSIIVPEERNYILNPVHPDFRHIAVRELRAFAIDSRLLLGPA